MLSMIFSSKNDLPWKKAADATHAIIAQVLLLKTIITLWYAVEKFCVPAILLYRILKRHVFQGQGIIKLRIFNLLLPQRHNFKKVEAFICLFVFWFLKVYDGEECNNYYYS